MRNRLVAETTTRQTTTLTTDRQPSPGRDSNPQSQPASGRSPLHLTTRDNQQIAIYNKRKTVKPKIHPSVIFLLQTKRTDSHLFIRLTGQYGESHRKEEFLELQECSSYRRNKLPYVTS